MNCCGSSSCCNTSNLATPSLMILLRAFNIVSSKNSFSAFSSTRMERWRQSNSVSSSSSSSGYIQLDALSGNLGVICNVSIFPTIMLSALLSHLACICDDSSRLYGELRSLNTCTKMNCEGFEWDCSTSNRARLGSSLMLSTAFITEASANDSSLPLFTTAKTCLTVKSFTFSEACDFDSWLPSVAAKEVRDLRLFGACGDNGAPPKQRIARRSRNARVDVAGAVL
mmetsp:Transcript_7276/g.9996  ORF Transcript_7276/g.9996 Transcript_7276/m.9996 type:complete len:226 (-) Transcript_7276:91-768(-)